MREQLKLKVKLLETQKQQLREKILKLEAQIQNINNKQKRICYEYKKLEPKVEDQSTSVDNKVQESKNFK